MASVPVDMKERFDAAIPNYGVRTRMRRSLKADFAAWSLRKMAKMPGFGGLDAYVDRPTKQEFHSANRRMMAWFEAPFGTDDKPEALAEIPWGYVEAKQDDIPFLGLREFWYPALRSDELPNNDLRTRRMLGDNIVLFRDGKGKPRALENRCPHRGPLLSLGQVGAWEPGTITCRYHGMTFNGQGECVAFIGDGPDSPACGRIKAKAYPVEEMDGIVWIYMGEREPPPVKDNLPHGHQVLGKDGHMVIMHRIVPYSHLNMLDNTVDMTHVGCLHRTCLLFGDQQPYGRVDYEEVDRNGVHARLIEGDGPAGGRFIDQIEWYPPNLVYHGPHEMGGRVHGGWFWFVPRDVGSFYAWQIISINKEKANPLLRRFLAFVLRAATTGRGIPGTACFLDGDAPMQMSQGRVARWDKEKLARTDRAVIKVRKIMENLHKAEAAERAARGTKVPRISRPFSSYGKADGALELAE